MSALMSDSARQATTRLTDEQLRSYARSVDYPDRCMATELLALRRAERSLARAALLGAVHALETTPETVERVARAIYETAWHWTPWSETHGTWRESYLSRARAALAALWEA